jgi:hypothetical protein
MEDAMQNANPTSHDRRATSIAIARQARESNGRVETAIISLAGLTVALVLMAHGFGAVMAQLFVSP